MGGEGERRKTGGEGRKRRTYPNLVFMKGCPDMVRWRSVRIYRVTDALAFSLQRFYPNQEVKKKRHGFFKKPEILELKFGAKEKFTEIF
jgi:hypothetical protein